MLILDSSTQSLPIPGDLGTRDWICWLGQGRRDKALRAFMYLTELSTPESGNSDPVTSSHFTRTLHKGGYYELCPDGQHLDFGNN